MQIAPLCCKVSTKREPLLDGSGPELFWFRTGWGWLFIVLDQGNQATHLGRRVARVHHMGEDVAVERIHTARSRPGREEQIIAFSWGSGNRLHLLRIRLHLSILCDHRKE